MQWRIPLADIDYSEEEEQAVYDVLRSRWLTMGCVTHDFEESFSEFIDVKHALAVSNATEALHLACRALEIGPGDEVIVPSLSFVATANAVLYTGARVCFADIIGTNELTIAPLEIEKRIKPQTKAVIVMHYAGYPCRMPEILDLTTHYGLFLIEDAAHAPGAYLNGKALGTWGDIGCFSFFSNKNLSTGEGGMLVTNRDNVAEKVRLLRSHGMTSLTWDRHKGHAHSYDVVDLGYNYRIDEIRSALGLVQLRKLAQNNILRKKITERYHLGLSSSDEPLVEIPFHEKNGQPAYHIYPILLKDIISRTEFIERMRESGVQTSIHYPPIHLFSYYRKHFPDFTLPLTEDVGMREVTLPLYPMMKDEEVDLVVSTVVAALEELQADS